MPVAELRGLAFEHELHGPEDGEPVLLVMGLGAQLIVWPVAFIEHLVAEGYRVITFDNRDIGRSGRVDAPAPTVKALATALVAPKKATLAYELGDMADDAAALLDHLGIERAHVVGASMGGMIAQELTIRHPAKVASLTSIMSNTGGRRVGRISPSLLPAFLKARSSETGSLEDAMEISRLIAGPHFDEQAARELHLLAAERAGDAAEAARGVSRQTLAVVATRDRTADLGRVTAPTLVIHGLVDKLVRLSGGIATARAVPGARLLVYPDMAHDVPAVRITEMAEAVVDNFHRGRIEARASA